MSDIEVQCPHCGTAFTAPDDMGGLLAACPACGKQVTVPLDDEDARRERSARLQVKKDVVITGGKKCPSCGSTMADGAVVCIECGYDTRSGRRIGERTPPSHLFRWIMWGLGLFILAMLVRSFLNSGSTTELSAPVEGSPASPTVQVSAVTAPATPAPAETAAPAGATPSPAAAQEVAAIDLSKEEANLRVSVKQQLDTKFPIYVRNATVVLRRTNGQVHRGILAEMKTESVILLVNDQKVEVPFKVLDLESRVRCDWQFRKRYIETEVQKRLKSLQKG